MDDESSSWEEGNSRSTRQSSSRKPTRMGIRHKRKYRPGQDWKRQPLIQYDQPECDGNGSSASPESAPEVS